LNAIRRSLRSRLPATRKEIKNRKEKKSKTIFLNCVSASQNKLGREAWLA
jgi:hypothetical protein